MLDRDGTSVESRDSVGSSIAWRATEYLYDTIPWQKCKESRLVLDFYEVIAFLVECAYALIHLNRAIYEYPQRWQLGSECLGAVIEPCVSSKLLINMISIS